MPDTFAGLGALSPNDQLTFNRFSRGAEIKPPFSLAHEAFESIVERFPSTVAVEHEGTKVTYGQIEELSNALANTLIENGLVPKQRVCLLVQRSIPMVVGILAVLKCGCQYIPLDGGVVPQQSLSHIIKDCQVSFVLCLERFTFRLNGLNVCKIITLDGGLLKNKNVDTERPSIDVDPSDGAYVIYTSGTTGTPKGVDVSHENVTNLLCTSPGNLGIMPGVNVAQILSVSFDMGQWEMLGTLLNGGTLLLRNSDWAAVLKRAQVVIATPSVLARFDRAEYPSIEVVALAGERSPKALLDEWAQDTIIYNCCGPTEVTIVNTMQRHKPGQDVSIGCPIPNTYVYVLDENDEPLPIGESGLMWAGGKCVSRGYINLPEETGKRFKRDKFANDGTYMYNTGDVGRWCEDGTLEYLGRVDDQVKIKGFRVELNSVSSSIEKIPGISKGCAIYHDSTLWGFYSGAFSLDEDTLRSVVQQYQPYYAVPSRWAFWPTLPLTTNGKIDKRALLSSVDQASPAFSHVNTPSKKVTIPQKAFEQSEKDLTIGISNDVSQSNLRLSSLDSLARSESCSSGSITKPEKVFAADRKDATHVTIVALSQQAGQISISGPDNGRDDEKYFLPDKKGRHGARALRHRFFSLYRRLFSIVFLGNLVAMVTTARFTPKGKKLESIATAMATNLTIAVLMRQDHVINFLFWVACSVPTSWPLCIRRNCAKVYHIGGLHSGCAVAACIWLLLFTVAVTIKFTMPAVLAVSYILVALLLSIIATAHPKIRSKFHNRFELIHRFAGWTSLALFWVQLILLVDNLRGSSPLGQALVAAPGFWLLFVASGSIILPWLSLRKVTVYSDVLSSHAVRLYFEYTTPTVGTAVRISNSPLVEWHAFATIAKPNAKGFSLLVSNAGDWTSHQISTAPTKLWVRGVPASGVLRIAPLFKSIVLVATGSGIGPCLPVIYAKRVPARILWSTPHPETTFGEEIIRAIKDADENAVIHNTRTMGRPDLVAISYRLLRESGAEAVCVISNQKITQMLVYAMESRGIPAFGAIFDS